MGQDKPLLRVLSGESLAKPPLWLMRQAGRYLPEYRATRTRAGGFLDLCYSPEFAAEVTLQPIRRFGFDAAILFADILLVPHALGQRLEFLEGEGPRLEPVTTSKDMAGLRLDGLTDRLQPVFETLERVKAALPASTTLIGFAGAPWTVATYMIAGAGTNDQAPAKRLAYQEPEVFDRLLDLITEATIAYLSRQAQAGAEVLQIFDTWAGGVSPALMERAVLQPIREIVTRLRTDHPDVKIIAFPRGIGSWLPRFSSEVTVDGLSLGTGEDVSSIQKAMPRPVALQGNLDPLVLVAGGPALDAAVKRLLDEMRGQPYIFNLGHGILPETPIDHVMRLVHLVREAR